MAAARRRLGGWTGPGTRGRVFLTDDAIEVDEHDGWHIARRRVFLDDIVLITLHRARSWMGFWTLQAIAATILMMGWAVASAAPGEVFYVFLIIASPFVLLSLLFLRAMAIVTVVGRRTRTRMSWWWRRDRAAGVHEELCRLAESRAGAPAAPQAG